MLKKMVVLGTGGTIAGSSTHTADNVGYRAAQLPVGSLLQSVVGLQAALGEYGLESEQVVQVDSKDMGWTQWSALVQRALHYLVQPEVTSLIITHGTDTLEETAFFLSQVLPSELLANKVLVLTCAMRPASSLTPDGPQNLRDAVVLARDVQARGVLVVCAGSIHTARAVQKVHPYRLDAFDSGEAGPLGYVEEGVVRWVHPCSVEMGHTSAMDAKWFVNLNWPRVEIVFSHAGASGALVRAMCAVTAADTAPVRGIVVAATGNGTLHQDLEAALYEAQSQGIRVVRCTRCTQGQIVSTDVSAHGFPHMGFSPVKARIALMLDLMR